MTRGLRRRLTRTVSAARVALAAAGLLALLGCERSSGATGDEPAAASRSAADAATAASPSSAVLALLPDGAEKRRFLLDCTGCHAFDVETAFPGGRPRSREAWRESVEKMLQMAGAQSPFPVISARRDPAATADWLAAHLVAPPSPPPASPLPDGAVVEEFLLPEPRDLPHDLAVDGDGRVVATGMFSHRMYVLDPASGVVSTLPIPLADANPRALEIDATGSWWVVLGAPGKIARYAPRSAAWTFFDIGTYAHEARRDARGRVWFNGHFSAAPELLGVLDPASGAIRALAVPGHPDAARESPIPYGLRVAPDGSVWGTELRGNRLFRYDPGSGRFGVWSLPTPDSGPRRLAIAPDGTVWIPQYAAGRLARFDPRRETFVEYPLPLRDALPYVVEVEQRDGTVWIGTGGADALLAFDPGPERFRVYPLPSRGALVRHLALDPRSGDVWAAYGASPGIPARLARLRVRPMGARAWPAATP